jgi:hypothetical protein
LAHDDTEPALPIGHYLKLPLVSCASQIWEIYNDRPAAFGLTSQPIYTAGSLFDFARVPVKIVMDNMAAESL